MLSFVVPAHDEQATIGAVVAAIDSAARSAGVEFEVIVVDDSSTDATAVLAEAAGARVVPVALRQISAVRNAGAAEAKGTVLVFVDADTLINAKVVAGLVSAIGQGAIGGGSAIRFDLPHPRWVDWVMPPALWLGRRARLAAGCFLFCDARVFRAVGGFSEEVFAGEEILLSRRLHQEGEFVILPEPVETSARKLRTYSSWQLMALVLRILAAGHRGLRERQGLGLWYGPRRADTERRE